MNQLLFRIDNRLAPIVSEAKKTEADAQPGDLKKVSTLARWLLTYSQELEAAAASAVTNNESLRNARARIIELKAAVEDAALEIEKVAEERGLPKIKMG